MRRRHARYWLECSSDVFSSDLPARTPKRRAATRRRPGRTPIRSHGTASRSGATSAEIRAWAVANGFDVGSKGRIPRAVVDDGKSVVLGKSVDLGGRGIINTKPA